ncbi:MAG: hypothetical protein ACI845_004333 [Gammaproteobacteria bacterium]|jgi:hypothetical protein
MNVTGTLNQCSLHAGGIDTLSDLDILLVEDDEDDYILTLDLCDQAYGDQYSLTWEKSCQSNGAFKDDQLQCLHD